VRGGALLVLGLVLAGCVSLTPQQQATVDELRLFADKTTAFYGLPRVRISIQPATNQNIGAIYRQGNIFVNVETLCSPDVKVLMAHELGHYLQGPQAAFFSSQADWQRAQELRELDANAKAVEILTRVEGMTERQAVQMLIQRLRRAQRAIDRGAPLTAGHRTPNEEIADLLTRFPDAR
jgi:Zn-dependent peptidase ImmA (M78 family)